MLMGKIREVRNSETFGMFKDDPTYAEFLEEVEKYRHERNNRV
jgi:hypothetical protein